MEKEEILKEMMILCEEAGYEPTKFIDKIANAKAKMFKDSDWHRCPCDGQNPNRFCISEQCHKDVEEMGHCHYNCYQKKSV